MLPEVLEYLSPGEGARCLDCTFGGGGHTRALLERGASVVAMDRDSAAGQRAQELLVTHSESFSFIDSDFGALSKLGLGFFDGILFDLGVSSYQLDEIERGFSFRSEAPADMRMDTRAGVPAAVWLETASEEMLVRAIRDFGEEPHWRRIVRVLREARGKGVLARTDSLAATIVSAIPARDRALSRMHPATRAFQGIRIAVNDELGAIERALPAAFGMLKAGGVLCVISFHSLEDRLVKQAFRLWCGQPVDREDSRPADLRVRLAEPLTRRPRTPAENEVVENVRSRSAKLRALRKL